MVNKKSRERRADDEKFIEGIYNDSEVSSIRTNCGYLNQAIPALIDGKSLFDYFNVCAIAKHKKESVDLYYTLIDELEDRIARGTAVLPTKRFRLFGEILPPWCILSHI